jgi:DivIVA domain-containing protein
VVKRGTIDRVMWVWVVVIVALAGGVAAVAVGRGGSLSEVYDDRPDAAVPAGRPLTADDLRDVRFSTAVRGYRMDEVDALLARIRADMIARESAPPDDEVHVIERPELTQSLASPTAAVDDVDESDDDADDDADKQPIQPGQHLSRRMGDERGAPDSEREAR